MIELNPKPSISRERISNSPKRIKAFEPHILERASLFFKHSMNAKRNKAKLLKQEISEAKARLEELNNKNKVSLKLPTYYRE